MIDLRVEEAFVIDYHRQSKEMRKAIQNLLDSCDERETVIEPIFLPAEKAAILGLQEGKYYINFDDSQEGEGDVVTTEVPAWATINAGQQLTPEEQTAYQQAWDSVIATDQLEMAG